MIYTRIIISILLLTYAASSLIAQQNNTALVRGDRAPSIKIMKWLSGTGIKEFEKGHVYVIEFGGVDCAPCRMSIPHLSELSKRYKDVATIISVFVYENGTQHLDTIGTAYVQRVAKFVRKMGNQISYTVGIDDPKQFMANAWLKAFGLDGIPQAFVIDQNGIIAWEGHPLDLDGILYNLVNKTFDFNTAVLEQYKKDSIIKRIVVEEKQHHYTNAIGMIDQVLKESPGKLYMCVYKFSILLQM